MEIRNAGGFPRIINIKGKGQIPTDITVHAIHVKIPNRSNYDDYEVSFMLENKIIIDGNVSSLLPRLYRTPIFGIKARTPFIIKPDDVELSLLGIEGYKPTPPLYIKGITVSSHEERVVYPISESKIYEIYDILTRGLKWEFSSHRWIASDRRFRITADRKILTENIPYNSPIFIPTSKNIPFITPFTVRDRIEFYHGKGVFVDTYFWNFVLIGYLKEVEHDKRHKAKYSIE